MFKITKFMPKFIKAIHYALLINKASDAHSKKDYVKALEYLKKACKVVPLLGEDLLTRAQINRRVEKYSESIEDSKLAINRIKKENYKKADKDYLVYYACRVGALSQIVRDGIDERYVDQEFKQVKWSNILKSKVSSHILRNFPL